MENRRSYQNTNFRKRNENRFERNGRNRSFSSDFDQPHGSESLFSSDRTGSQYVDRDRFDENQLHRDEVNVYPNYWDPARGSRMSGYTSFDRFNRYEDRPFSDYENRSWRSQEKHEDRSVIDKVKDFFGKGPKGYKRSDERIKEDVSEMLYRHPRIDASEIEVDVKDGMVTLTGTVEDRHIKRLVEDAVEDCTGVRDVSNQLRVMGKWESIENQSSTGASQQTAASLSGKSKSIQ